MDSLTPSTETWCIDDTLFYPMGLINHTTGNKTVFVTWSDKCLMNFIFKKVTPTANRCNKFMINVPEEIQDIVILEVNTLVLLKNGQICYFSSIKSIHRIPWLNSGVRCVSQSLEGFSLIRVLEDKRISFEIYSDVPNVGKTRQEAKRTFDISFDERNLFDSDWSDDRFCLTSVGITEKNRKFLELLVGVTDLKAMEVHIFSVSNSLFALYVEEEDDFEIKTLAPQVSNVELLKFLPYSNMLLIFLNCGIIEVWYLSEIALVLERYTYINGSEFVHHTFSGEVLYFTDEQRVGRLQFSCDAVDHTCRVIEQSIDAPGMVALTYEEVTESLVCLSNNNIFYHLSFKDDQRDDEETTEDEQMHELTDAKFNEMLSKSQLISDTAAMPGKIDKLIEEEYRKQELIAVCRKSAIYSELITAEISFSQHIPESKDKLIYPTDNGIPPFTYFAVVSLKILSHDIFRSTTWSLMIAYLSHMWLLCITPELLRSKFSVLIPIKRNQSELIPEFEIQMVTHVNLEQDYVCINIPVTIKTLDAKKLFSRNQGLTQLNQKSEISFGFKMTTPDLHTSLIHKVFGFSSDVTFEHETDVLIQDLYFLGQKVIISFCEETKLFSVQSNDPVAIYYAKSVLMKYLYEKCSQTLDDNEELRNTLLELQCQVEKKYGALMDEELHLASLKRVYEKLRNDILWKF